MKNIIAVGDEENVQPRTYADNWIYSVVAVLDFYKLLSAEQYVEQLEAIPLYITPKMKKGHRKKMFWKSRPSHNEANLSQWILLRYKSTF